MADETTQGVEEQGGAPVAAPVVPGSDAVERRLAEVEGREQQLLQIAVTQYINSLPEDKRAAAQLEIADRMRREKEAQLEEKAKRIVIHEKAIEYGLDRMELEKLTLNVGDPRDIDNIASYIAKLKGDAKESRKRAVESKEESALAGTRPDSGGSAGAPSRQDIIARFRGTGRIADMREALRVAGYE